MDTSSSRAIRVIAVVAHSAAISSNRSDSGLAGGKVRRGVFQGRDVLLLLGDLLAQPRQLGALCRSGNLNAGGCIRAFADR